jgi:hypothetical protein
MRPKVSWESLPTVVLAWGDLCIPHSCDVPRRPSRRSGPQVTLRVAIRRRRVGSHILVRRLCFIVGHDWVRKRRAPTAPIGPFVPVTSQHIRGVIVIVVVGLLFGALVFILHGVHKFHAARFSVPGSLSLCFLAI